MKPLLLLSLLVLTACSPKLAPTIAPAPSHDTLISHHHTLDSVRITTDTRYRFGLTKCEPTPPKRVDTLVTTQVVERYRIRHDTIRVVRCDSIPYPVEVPIEVAKPIPKVYRYALWFVILFVLYWLVRIAKVVYLRR